MDAKERNAIAEEIERTSDFQYAYERILRVMKGVTQKADAFPFDLTRFPAAEAREFLTMFLSLLDKDRKLLSNLSKTDADRNLEPLIQEFLQKERELYGNPAFVPASHSQQQVDRALYEACAVCRDRIRRRDKPAPDAFRTLADDIITDFAAAVGESRAFRDAGIENIRDSLFMVYQRTELFLYALFQSVNYLIIDNPDMGPEAKRAALHAILNGVGTFQPRDASASDVHIFHAYATYLYYLDTRNRYKTEIEILKLLNGQMDAPEYVREVAPEYQCRGRWLHEIPTKTELRNVILEGATEKEERFNKNLEDAQKLIVFLNAIAGRELHPKYLQHVKVVYREVVADRLTYQKRQARTIMRLLEADGNWSFDRIKDSYFIREKISRGFFREKGYVEEYRLKNDLQIQFYKLSLFCFDSYDELDIADRMLTLFSQTAKVVGDALSAHCGPPTS